MISFLTFMLFIGVSIALPAKLVVTDPASASAPLEGLFDPLSPAKEFYLQNHAGKYHYGYSFPGQARSEYRGDDGIVYGYYSYQRHSGDPVIVLYRAGAFGFEAKSNVLPINQTPQSAAATLPRDTPVVAAAKQKFKETYEAAYIKALKGNFPHLVQ